MVVGLVGLFSLFPLFGLSLFHYTKKIIFSASLPVQRRGISEVVETQDSKSL